MPSLRNQINSDILDLKHAINDMLEVEEYLDSGSVSIRNTICYCPAVDNFTFEDSDCLEFRAVLHITSSMRLTGAVIDKIAKLVHAKLPYLAVLLPTVLGPTNIEIKLRGFSSENTLPLMGFWLPPLNTLADQLQQEITDAQLDVDVWGLDKCVDCIQVYIAYDHSYDQDQLTAVFDACFDLYGHSCGITYRQQQVRVTTEQGNQKASSIVMIYYGSIDDYTGERPLLWPLDPMHWKKQGYVYSVTNGATPVDFEYADRTGASYEVAEYLADHLDRDEHILLVQALAFAKSHTPAGLELKMQQLIDKVCPPSQPSKQLTTTQI